MAQLRLQRDDDDDDVGGEINERDDPRAADMDARDEPEDQVRCSHCGKWIWADVAICPKCRTPTVERPVATKPLWVKVVATLVILMLLVVVVLQLF